jgi:hypothetical protein
MYRRILVVLMEVLRPATEWVLGDASEPEVLLTMSSREEGTLARLRALQDLNLEVTAASSVLFIIGCVAGLLTFLLPASVWDWVFGLVVLPLFVFVVQAILRHAFTIWAAARVEREGLPSPRVSRVLIPNIVDLCLPLGLMIVVIASHS